ncbi:hypothetical protein [Dactylosporangium sp. NPDC051541]|uniref:hypothetical protein n=1 Tax=Dactylosporangium sp. NPDC051541 TaxID=3363977 RepID=UPI00378F84BA
MAPPVVVGVDGGRSALAAVDHDAAEAVRRGLALRIMHADGWCVPPRCDIQAVEGAPDDAGAARPGPVLRW